MTPILEPIPICDTDTNCEQCFVQVDQIEIFPCFVCFAADYYYFLEYGGPLLSEVGMRMDVFTGPHWTCLIENFL